MPPKCKIGRSGGCTDASATQIGRNWRTKILEIFLKHNLAQVRRAPCTGDIGNFLPLDPNLRILKQDTLGNLSGIWVLLATMASLLVGLFQVLLTRNYLEISCMDWTVPMDFWLMCWWTSSHWACIDSGNFVGSCKCQC